MIAYQHTPWGRTPIAGDDARQIAIEVHVPEASAALLSTVATYDGVEPEKFAADAVMRAVSERAKVITDTMFEAGRLLDDAGKASHLLRTLPPEKPPP